MLSMASGQANINVHRDAGVPMALEPKHKIFLSHSGAQKPFAEELCKGLERRQRYPFFDVESLIVGENFPERIFLAIQQCYVGVVILSEDFVTTKWPMMELVAMVEEAKKRENFTLVPVFLHISPEDLSDAESLKKWRGIWNLLALENPGRIEACNCEAALKYLRRLNGLVRGVSKEPNFMTSVIDSICKIVRPEVQLEDSHIQGKFRLCKVMQDQFDLQIARSKNSICIVGLYGDGGMGKTTLCTALCNNLSTRFRGRVCHAEMGKNWEMGKTPERELLQHVLERLSDTNRKYLKRFEQTKLQNGLKEGKFIRENPIFLALDNMLDTPASIQEAEVYLSARLPSGSIVLITTRYKEALSRLRPYVDVDNCIEMPTLEENEARSLFVASAKGVNEDDDQLIERCLRKCYFKNSDSSYHYNPLVLDVLARELEGLDDPTEWKPTLDADDDVFNQSQERNHHPVFFRFRSSYDRLIPEDQLLFMDVALFLPSESYSNHITLLRWLAMVHGNTSNAKVLRGLKRLRKKALLQSFDEDVSSQRSIHMHDLWREFSKAETKSGKMRNRQWVYETGACSDSSPSQKIPSGNCWETVERMAFLEVPGRDLHRVHFEYFSNVTALKILVHAEEVDFTLDLRRLARVRSLEIWGSCLRSMTIQGLPRDLTFLSLKTDETHNLGPCNWDLVETYSLRRVKCLQLEGCTPVKMQHIEAMSSLHEAYFNVCPELVMVEGMRWDMRVLSFSHCQELRSCPHLGQSKQLEELYIIQCAKYESSLDLTGLTKLRILDLTGSESIKELLGLSELVALEVFNAGGLETLPDLSKLTKLRELNLSDCQSIKEVKGFDSLTSLQEVIADFRQVADKLTFGQLTKLEVVNILGWSVAGIKALSNMTLMKELTLHHCTGVDELPDLSRLTTLHTLSIKNCGFKDVSELCNLSALESLHIFKCNQLEKLPGFQRLTRLKSLEVSNCSGLRRWNCPLAQEEVEGSSENVSMMPETQVETLHLRNRGLANLMSVGSSMLLEGLELDSLPITQLPDLSNFPRLTTLRVTKCESLVGFTCRGLLTALSELAINECRSLEWLPDLQKLARLKSLKLMDCPQLRRLGTELKDDVGVLSDVPNFVVVTDLETVLLRNCGLDNLTSMTSCSQLKELEIEALPISELPDLCSNFKKLRSLKLYNCKELAMLSSSGPLTALTSLEVTACNTLIALPELTMFQALTSLNLEGCNELKTLRCSSPLTALRSLDLRGCTSLNIEQPREVFPNCIVVYEEKKEEEYEWADLDIWSDDSSDNDNSELLRSHEEVEDELRRSSPSQLLRSHVVILSFVVVLIGIANFTRKRTKRSTG